MVLPKISISPCAENELPRRTNDRRETELPVAKKSKMEAAEPNEARDRMDIELASVTWHRIEALRPM
jgi:hypothetical protein